MSRKEVTEGGKRSVVEMLNPASKKKFAVLDLEKWSLNFNFYSLKCIFVLPSNSDFIFP